MANLMISTELLANENNGIFANAIGDCMTELSENTEIVQLADKSETTIFHAKSVTGKDITLRRESDIAYLKAGKLLSSVDKESDKLKALVCAYWKENDNWKVLTADGEKTSFSEVIETQFPTISSKAANNYVNVANAFLEAVYDDGGTITGVQPKSKVIPELPMTVYQVLLSVVNDSTLGIAAIEKAFIDGSIYGDCKGGKLTQARAKEWVAEVRPAAKRGSAEGGNGSDNKKNGEKTEKKPTISTPNDALLYVKGSISEMIETLNKNNVLRADFFDKALNGLLKALDKDGCLAITMPAENAAEVVNGELE